MADYSDPKRATAYRFTLSLYARSDNQIKTAPTLAAGDVKVSKDNGATANITTLPSEAPASSGILQVDLSATEMTADLVTVIFRDAAGAEWNDVAVHIAPSTVQMADLATAENLATVDTVVDAILVDTTEIGAAGAGLTAVPWNAAWDAEVQSEVADALAVYDPPTNTEMTTAFTEIKGATWATTDTLEAIRDRGDAAWVTATGFSTLDAAGVRTAVGLASANLDTQIGTLATASALTTVDTVVDAIKAKTDSLIFTVAGQVDANIQYVNDVLITGNGQTGTEWGP